MPPAFVLSQDQTLRKIYNLLIKEDLLHCVWLCSNFLMSYREHSKCFLNSTKINLYYRFVRKHRTIQFSRNFRPLKKQADLNNTLACFIVPKLYYIRKNLISQWNRCFLSAGTYIKPLLKIYKLFFDFFQFFFCASNHAIFCAALKLVCFCIPANALLKKNDFFFVYSFLPIETR